MTRAMPLGLSNEIFWPAAVGGAALAWGLAAPFVHRGRLALHARRVEARQRRGHDRYHDELRSLEAWTPQGDATFGVRTIFGAVAAAALFALMAYVWVHPESDRLMPAITLAAAIVGLVGAAWQGFRIWRDAQPDPRTQIISPAHDDGAARDRRTALWGQIGSTVALAAGSFVMALFSAEKALELLQ